MALVKSGAPADVSAFDLVEVEGLRVYVPRDKKFGDDIPKITNFPRATGHQDVGVSNVAK